MKILSFETSTHITSVALTVGEQVFEKTDSSGVKATEVILPMIEELLYEQRLHLKELDAIAFGQGPGAFTGVRLAASIAQGLAFAHDISTIGISSLATMAEKANQVFGFQQVDIALDARRSEIYYARYQMTKTGVMQSVVSDTLLAPENLRLINESAHKIGQGWLDYQTQLTNISLDNFTHDQAMLAPSAAYMMRLARHAVVSGQGQSAQNALPLYLRGAVG